MQASLAQPGNPVPGPLGFRQAAWAIAAAVLVGALSAAVLPTQPVNDPNIWLVWAHQLTSGGLTAFEGPTTAWKPLPVLLLAGPAAVSPDVATFAWVTIARASAVVIAFVCFRIAWRRGGWAAGVGAALVPFLFQYWFLGTLGAMSELLAVALILGAIEANGAGRERIAFALLVTASLTRPDLAFLPAFFGLWMLRQSGARELPVLVAGGAVFVGCWFGLAWLLFGDPVQFISRGLDWTRDEGAWLGSIAPEAVASPWLFGALLALAAVGARFAWLARDRFAIGCGLASLACMVGLLATGLSSGPQVPRYALPALVLLVPLAAGGLGELILRRPPGLHRIALTALAGIFMIAIVVSRLGPIDAAVERARTIETSVAAIRAAVDEVGGPDRVRQCAPVTGGEFLIRSSGSGPIVRSFGWDVGDAMPTATAPTVLIEGPASIGGAQGGKVTGGTGRRVIAERDGWKLVYVPGRTGCGGF